MTQTGSEPQEGRSDLFSSLQPSRPEDGMSEQEQGLLWRARPNEYAVPFFNYHMRIATVLGMDWVQAVNYVAEKRLENGRAVIASLRAQACMLRQTFISDGLRGSGVVGPPGLEPGTNGL